ncbi:MAG: exosortase/archaeosortase family protein [Candidatus Methanofastidiosia archaeon]|jgi:exosortase/archaeosortase family protein
MKLSPLNEPVKYILKASIIAVLVYGAARVLPAEEITSLVTANVLTWWGVPAVSYQESGRVYLEYLYISIDCTALEVVAIFLGLILAVNTKWIQKIVFSVFVSGTVFVANIARISVVYYLLEHGIPWYIAHDIFSGGLAIAAGMLFLLVSEQYMPEINQYLYTLLEQFENALSRIR